jgi:hypothetical protein
MSGAGVVTTDLIVAVVRSHNLAAGGQSLTITPITAIGLLPVELGQRFQEALGVNDLSLLPTLPSAQTQPSSPASGSAAKPCAADVPPTSLVDSILAIREMNDPEFRQRVYDRVPAPVVQQLRRDTRARIELIGLIDTFGDYAHLHPWEAMLTRLYNLLPENPAVRQLGAELAKLGIIDPPPSDSYSGH